MLGTSDVSTHVDQSASRRAERAKHVRAVSDTLRGYAERGAFRSFSDGTLRSGKVTYRMLWHYNRTYRLILDLHAQSLTIPDMLPGVPPRAPMTSELRAFLKPFSTEQLEHRRLNADKGQLKLTHYRQALTLRIIVKQQQEFAYCTRKLVHIAHEVFMVFLREGPYYEYRVEKLGLDPDAAWA